MQEYRVPAFCYKIKRAGAFAEDSYTGGSDSDIRRGDESS